MAKITKEQTSPMATPLGFAGATVDTLSNKTNGKVSVGGKIGAGALQGAAAGAAAGPIGMMIGAGVGAIVGGITASKTNKNITEAENMERQRLLENRETMYNDFSKSVYSTYPSQGITGSMMYGKYGGMMPKRMAKGGLMPLTGTTSQAVGDNHGNDTDGDGRPGVPVMDANGNQKAELENKEVVFVDAMGKEKVLSQELGTADVARQIMSSPDYMKTEGMFEKKVNNINKQLERMGTDKFTLGTNQERLRGVKHPLDNLYNEQERMKANMKQSTPTTNQPQMMKLGGEIGDDDYLTMGTKIKRQVDSEFDAALDSPNFMTPKGFTPIKPVNNSPKINTVSPSSVTLPKVNNDTDSKSKFNMNDVAPAISFIDNAYNAYLNSKRPPVPAPNYMRALPMNTKINIDPQLTENKNMLTGLYRNIDQTTDNNQVARANKIAAMSSTIKQTNELMGKKANIETELGNKNLLNTQQVTNMNIGLKNQFDMNKMMAKDDIMMANSENVANAVTKATMLMRQENLKELDKKKMQIILAKYRNSGVLTRAELDFIDEIEKTNK